MLCITSIYIVVYEERCQIINENKQEEDIKEVFYSGTIKKKLNIQGRIFGNLLIDSINLDKMIIRSSIEKMQYNLDLNNIVTNNSFSDRVLFLYGHYTEISGFVLNKLNKVKVNDNIVIKTSKNNLYYKVSEKGQILKKDINKLKENNSVIILTCTSDFNDDKYYYIKGINRGDY